MGLENAQAQEDEERENRDSLFHTSGDRVSSPVTQTHFS
jgi:hypothetical protein